MPIPAEQRSTYRIVLRPGPGVDGIRMLRQALKVLGRRFGLAAVSVEEIKPEVSDPLRESFSEASDADGPAFAGLRPDKPIYYSVPPFAISRNPESREEPLPDSFVCYVRIQEIIRKTDRRKS